MREQALRASSSSYPDRAEYRQGQGHGRAKSSGTRSRRSANLANLARELGGQDLLGAALGLTDEAVTILVDGRDHARENQYGAHLAARLKDAGIPASWLDQTNAKITPEYLSALRKFAAASSNKAPIRRANFRRIAAAFEGREQVLADALEMVASAIPNVVDGLLELDDGRFGHMNPRLMRAGFPDSWLEEAEPDLTDALLLSLEQLATDEYERHFEEDQAARVAHEGQAFVAPTPEPSPAVQPTAAAVDKPKETVMAPKSQPTRPSLPQQQPEFKAGGMPSAAAKPMAHPSAAAPRVNRNLLAAGRSISGPAAKPIGSAPAKSISRAAPPAQMPQLPGQQAAASTGVPTASNQAAAAPATLPVKTDAPASTAQATQASAPAAKPANTTAPRGTVSKEVSLARADALEKLLKDSRRGAKVTLWRDMVGSSLPFWGNIRRGAVLFRDDLAQAVEKALELPEGWLDKPTYPPASVAAWLTDEAVPLPQGTNAAQGDGADGAQAQGDAADQGADGSAAPDSAAQAPAAPAAGAAKKAGGSKKGSEQKRDMSKPFATNRAPQPPRVTMAGQPPATPPVLPGADATPAVDERQLQLVDMGSPAPGMPLASASQASDAAQGAQAPAAAAPAAASPVVAPVPAPAQIAPVAAAPAATITPNVGPFAAAGALLTSQPQPGPLTQALMSIITAKSATGTFTETDALALINKLMGN